MIDLDERYKEKKSFFNRLIIVYAFFGFAFAFFLYRTYSIQVSEYTEYETAALENKTKEVLVQPIRGIIYDRSGKIIVRFIYLKNLRGYFLPIDLRDHKTLLPPLS